MTLNKDRPLTEPRRVLMLFADYKPIMHCNDPAVVKAAALVSGGGRLVLTSHRNLLRFSWWQISVSLFAEPVFLRL